MLPMHMSPHMCVYMLLIVDAPVYPPVCAHIYVHVCMHGYMQVSVYAYAHVYTDVYAACKDS